VFASVLCSYDVEPNASNPPSCKNLLQETQRVLYGNVGARTPRVPVLLRIFLPPLVPFCGHKIALYAPSIEANSKI